MAQQRLGAPAQWTAHQASLGTSGSVKIPIDIYLRVPQLRDVLDAVASSSAIALPACSAAGIKLMLRLSTAYGLIRRQFGSPIARMEALDEPLARMVDAAYVMEAARGVTAAMIGCGEKPATISALMKYQATVQDGRAVCDGPANYLQSAYQMSPTAITVEGANIVTRGLLAFTLGAMRSHPYLQKEIQACADNDASRGLASFEKAGHRGSAIQAW